MSEEINWVNAKEAYPDMTEFIENKYGPQEDMITVEDYKNFWEEWDIELESRVEE